MATSTTPKLTFHFPVAATPTKISPLLSVLQSADAPIHTASALEAKAAEYSGDSTRFGDAWRIANDVLKLFGKTSDGLQLTQRSRVILARRESVQYDLLHFLFYDAWRVVGQSDPRAWFYRTLTDHLWELQETTLDDDALKSLTQEMSEQAKADFQEVVGFRSETFSFGRQSREGGLAWLAALQPAVIVNDPNKRRIFRRRISCSAELLLLAISRSYVTNNIDANMDMLLTDQRRREICQICLLDPNHLERMLDWMLPQFPHFVRQGTHSSVYGRFVRLHRLVIVEDLLA